MGHEPGHAYVSSVDMIKLPHTARRWLLITAGEKYNMAGLEEWEPIQLNINVLEGGCSTAIACQSMQSCTMVSWCTVLCSYSFFEQYSAAEWFVSGRLDTTRVSASWIMVEIDGIGILVSG